MEPVHPVRKKTNKRDAILDAMLDVVVERGFHEAPMSLIIERSGASAGVIYHYFQSKEEIIQALYERVRALKRTSLLEGYSPEMEAKEAFLQVWTNGYHFYRKHLKEMRFLDQYETAGFVCHPDSAARPDKEKIGFERRFRSRSKGGVLNELPPEVIQELTFGVVARLARQPRKLSPKVMRDVAEKVWEAIKASD
ncbi:TetR family transcriptional regulator [Edaphobacter modestus]|uniref:TetR family transcriptional regulator n=1 Tax=Edaphobacter modestus TaxID=388466 RepID=A0A4Q7YYB2_9BACT|nr:TetR family transcriptional regulator [Edaphobacter modestus]